MKLFVEILLEEFFLSFNGMEPYDYKIIIDNYGKFKII